MGKKIICAILIMQLIGSTLIAQQNTFNTLEEVLSYHHSEFKNSIPEIDNLFFEVRLDSIELPEAVIALNPNIELKRLEKGKRDYLIRFFIYSSDGITTIKAINFRLIKKRKRRIEYINLGNGNTYKLLN